MTSIEGACIPKGVTVKRAINHRLIEDASKGAHSVVSGDVAGRGAGFKELAGNLH